MQLKEERKKIKFARKKKKNKEIRMRKERKNKKMRIQRKKREMRMGEERKNKEDWHRFKYYVLLLRGGCSFPATAAAEAETGTAGLRQLEMMELNRTC